MKIAVLSDIHANYPALLEVAEHIEKWNPDRVYVAGDIVNRGPRPAECLSFVLNKQKAEGWEIVRGNHEDYIIFHNKPNAPRTGRLFDIYQSGYWTYQKLNGDVSILEAFPFQINKTYPNAGEFRVTHASMQGNQKGIYRFTSDKELRTKIHPPPAILCVGHTHRPLIRRVDRTLVVNSGSVGLPFDGDHRTSYAQITWADNTWQAQIIRFPYNRQQAECDYIDSGFLSDGGPLVRLILLEMRLAYSQLYQWSAKYRDRVLSGDINLTSAVREYCKNPNTRYI